MSPCRKRALGRRAGHLLLAALAGCSSDSARDFARGPQCASYDALSLEGAWIIRGTGTRSGCSDKRLNGDIELESDELIVDARRSRSRCEADAPREHGFSDCISSRDVLLTSVTRTAGQTLRFTGLGSVDDCAFTFRLVESASDGSELDYLFEGNVDGPDYSFGRFSGTGPERCEVSGRFEILRR
jgi:hypothetical protein